MKKIISLNGEWDLAWGNDKTVINVPSDINVELSKNGYLPENLFYRENLKAAKVFERTDFVCTKVFDIKKQSCKYVLNMDGVDTFADVYLNGEQVFVCDNMYKSYREEVTDKIVDGRNELKVCFHSTRNILEDLDKKYPNYFSIFTHGRNLVRHAQCQFGWDWSPDCLSCGIWKDVWLEEAFSPNVEDLYVESDIDGTITARCLLTQPVENGKMRIKITFDGKEVAVAQTDLKGYNNFTSVKIESPQLWWPKGYGKQNLYLLKAEILSAEGEILDAKEVTFGIKKVELEESFIRNDKVSFVIKVNGVRTFIKGANWVPSSCFPGSIPEETIEYLVKRASEANFTMLRIWGGGIYEIDRFYELCDKYGIMVWQDFMTACAEYPDDQMWFLENIIEEATQVVKRLRNHPSVSVYCGGNESSNSHRYEPKQRGKNLVRYYLRGVVGHLTKNTVYVESSPHSKNDFGQIQTSGDTHWSLNPRKSPATWFDYRQRLKEIDTSFNSEVCLQGATVYESYLNFLDENDIYPATEAFHYHVMYHPLNKDDIYFYRQLLHTQETVCDVKNAKNFVSGSMMAHAESVREELQLYRTQKFENGGAMLWMFNESWPCANWAIVDFYGYMKPAYYIAKKAFDVICVTVNQVSGNTDFFISNDSLRKFSGTAVCTLKKLDGKEIFKYEDAVTVEENSVLKVLSLSADQTEKADYARIEFVADNKTYSYNYFFDLFKNVNFQKPDLKMKIIDRSADKTVVSVSSNVYARFVYFDFAGKDIRNFTLSDNYFDLQAGEEKIVEILSQEKDFNLEVKSLINDIK